MPSKVGIALGLGEFAHEGTMPEIPRRELGPNASQEVNQLGSLQAAFDVGLGETKLSWRRRPFRADRHARVARRAWARERFLPRPDRSWREPQRRSMRCPARCEQARRCGRAALCARAWPPLTLPLPACAETGGRSEKKRSGDQGGPHGRPYYQRKAAQPRQV